MTRVKASHLIKPADKTPSGFMYLPENDQSMPITHATIIYFYKSSTVSNLSLSSITHILTTSLSKALSVFHPYSGRLQLTSRNRLQLNLNSAGALLLEAESAKSVDDFGDFCPTKEISELIPSVDYSRPIHEIPLLLVQITKFICGGVSLGLGFQHTVADGVGVFHFISEWARIARGELPKNLPFLDRSVINLNLGESETEQGFELDTPQPVLIDGPGPDEERRKETTVVMLKLGKDQIESLKKTANQDLQTGVERKQFTRYEALTAHMWRCISIARGLKDEQPTRLRIALNFRRQLNPPLPDKYFGNAILVVSTDATTKDLLLQPLGYAADKVRAGLQKGTNEHVRALLAHLNKVEDFNKLRYFHIVGSRQGAFRGNPNIAITSWIGLTKGGADFGWGKEIYMGPGLVGFDGKAFVFPHFANDDGSLKVALRLRTAHIDSFMKLFYENLSNMSKL